MAIVLDGRNFARNSLFAAIGIVISMTVFGAQASSYKKLYDFCAEANCADGSKPVGPLLRDTNGNLYGVTGQGGDANQGTIFKLANTKGVYLYQRLHSFCAQQDCTDGASPTTGLIRDMSGNLYGATGYGGAANQGIVYQLTKAGHFKILYSACKRASCKDGAAPVGLTYVGADSGKPYDGVSTLYGVDAGGGKASCGVIFRLNPEGRKWSWSPLYQFCSGGSTGFAPSGDILATKDGSIYGAAQRGGLGSLDGTLFRIDANGNASDLYKFCSQDNCTDGNLPNGGLVRDSGGVLHGTTQAGGEFNAGVVFAYSAKAGYSSYEFHGSDGAGPNAGLTADPSGNLFGTTTFGGSNLGNIFQAFDEGFADIYDFCGATECGDAPEARMISDASGNLYGTTHQGGVNDGGDGAGAGVVFEFTP